MSDGHRVLKLLSQCHEHHVQCVGTHHHAFVPAAASLNYDHQFM